MNIVITDKTTITLFEINNGEMLIKYGSNGKVKMEYKGYAVQDVKNQQQQIRLFCSELSVFAYFRSFENLFKSLDALLDYLDKAEIAKKSEGSADVVIDEKALDGIDMKEVHSALEKATGMKIQF